MASSVCTDASGNSFVAGNFQSPTMTLGSITLTSAGSSFMNVFIAKYDVNGNVLWAKNAGGDFNSAVSSITTDKNGNALVTGYFGSTTLTFGNITLTNDGPYGSNYDVFVVKYDSNGNVLWAKNAGGTYSGCLSVGNSVSTDANGDVLVTGYFTGAIDFSTISLSSKTGSETFLVKYDASGNILWVRQSVGTGSHENKGNAVHTDGNGNVFITGIFADSAITFGAFTITNTSVPGYLDLFLAKYDASGNVLWVKGAAGKGNDQGFSVATDASGNVFITGSFDGNTLTLGSIPLTIIYPTFLNMFIAKYDANGNVLWAKNAGGYWGGCMGMSLNTESNGNIFVTGVFGSSTMMFGNTLLNNPGINSSLFLVKYDPNGNVLCASSLKIGSSNSSLNGSSGGVSADMFGNAYLAGGFASDPFIVGNTALHTTSQSVFVAKYSCSNFAATISTVNPYCNKQCTGTATATPLGGTAPYKYNWSNGQITQTITGLCAGTYTLIIRDANNNYSATNIITITQPSAVTLTTATTNFCIGGSGSATVNASGGTPAYSYSWNTGQSTSAITGLSAGTYSVVITDANGCINSTTATITSLPTPTGIITGNTKICADQSTTLTASGGGYYSWNTGTTGSSIIVSPTTSTTYSVSVSNGYCSDDTSVTVIVNPLPQATISGNTSICSGQNTTLNASGGGTYYWSNSSTSNSISVSPSANTSYSVTITSVNGCTNTANANITVTPMPVALVSPNTTICSGKTVSLNASGGISYIWSSGQITSSITVTPALNTTYSVIIANGNCKDTASTTVTVNPSPVATTSGNITIYQGQSTTLSANGGVNYLWNTGATTKVITVAPSATTVYCVTVTSANNCSDIACATVNIESPCDTAGAFFFPNAFSPNNDGENDLLKVYYTNKDCIEALHLIIYNRWGENIFETTDPNFQWDGNYIGKIPGTNVLSYYLFIRFEDRKQINRKGNISMLR